MSEIELADMILRIRLTALQAYHTAYVLTCIQADILYGSSDALREALKPQHRAIMQQVVKTKLAVDKQTRKVWRDERP